MNIILEDFQDFQNNNIRVESTAGGELMENWGFHETWKRLIILEIKSTEQKIKIHTHIGVRPSINFPRQENHSHMIAVTQYWKHSKDLSLRAVFIQ